MSDVTVERGNPVEVTVVQGDPIEVSLSYAVTPDIANGSLALAKLADLAASRLIGRGSAGGTGAPEAITIGAGLSMSGTSLTSSIVGMTVNVYEYHSDTGSGNRTPTAGTEFWIVEGCAGGAAGQAGGTTVAGAGGAGGNYVSLVIPAALLTGEMSITVGAGATIHGAPAGSTRIQRVSDSVVLFQAPGNNSNFNSCFLGVGFSTNYGSGGSAGIAGKHGGYGPGGGGGGASTNTQVDGGVARSFTVSNSQPLGGGGGAGGSGQVGANGSSGSIHASGFGAGGGGGGFNASGAGGNGGAGVRGGGGGGGGRGATAGGAGGAGGAGFIRIIEVVRA